MIGSIRRIGTIGGVNAMSVGGGCRCGGVGGGWWWLLLLLWMVMRRTTMMTVVITVVITVVVVVTDVSTSINIHTTTTHIDIPMHHGGG